jgi:RNA polymerase sigma-70 factor (ECF subfamily)
MGAAMAVHARHDAGPHLRLVPPPPRGGVVPEGASRAALDERLVRALRDGDIRAAGDFHDRVRPRIDAVLFRMLGRRDMDHDDLAQRALIELFHTIERYRAQCSLDAWTEMLTARVVYKHLRRRKLERRLFADVPDDALPGFAGRAETVGPLLRNLVARLEGLLATMNRERVWVFLLHDVWGYDLREIAEITSRSPAAVQSLLSRGRREIHARIAADPELADRVGWAGGGR